MQVFNCIRIYVPCFSLPTKESGPSSLFQVLTDQHFSDLGCTCRETQAGLQTLFINQCMEVRNFMVYDFYYKWQ